MAHPEHCGEALLPVVRVTGRRWSIAMRVPQWELFASTTVLAARPRLTVVLEHFCDHGERDLPKGAFRWLSPADRSPELAREGAFEAYGVVLRGHAAERVFFVTSIEIDVDAPVPPRHTRRVRSDQRQHALPLFTAFEGREDGQDRAT